MRCSFPGTSPIPRRRPSLAKTGNSEAWVLAVQLLKAAAVSSGKGRSKDPERTLIRGAPSFIVVRDSPEGYSCIVAHEEQA